MELDVNYIMLRSTDDNKKFEIYRIVKGQHKPNKLFWGLTFEEAAPIIEALQGEPKQTNPPETV